MKLDKPFQRKLQSRVVLAIRLGLGLLFLWSSLPKMRQPYDFLSAIYDYEFLGPKFGIVVAMALPWLELVVGTCLIGGIFIGGALLASIAMSVAFTCVLASALYRGMTISCGCFGSADGEPIGYGTLVRACLILLASVFAYCLTIDAKTVATEDPPAI